MQRGPLKIKTAGDKNPKTLPSFVISFEEGTAARAKGADLILCRVALEKESTFGVTQFLLTCWSPTLGIKFEPRKKIAKKRERNRPRDR